jgi:hypothetical protein
MSMNGSTVIEDTDFVSSSDWGSGFTFTFCRKLKFTTQVTTILFKIGLLNKPLSISVYVVSVAEGNQQTGKCKNKWSWNVQGITFQLHGGIEEEMINSSDLHSSQLKCPCNMQTVILRREATQYHIPSETSM